MFGEKCSLYIQSDGTNKLPRKVGTSVYQNVGCNNSEDHSMNLRFYQNTCNNYIH